MKKFLSKKLKAFTMLEMLIVISVMVLLLGIVFMSINNARAHTRDQARIANIKRIEIGLANYYQVCKEYPKDLQDFATCDRLSATAQGTPDPKTLADFIPGVSSFGFNMGTGYLYTPITYDVTYAGTVNCVADSYHIGVTLEEKKSTLAERDSEFDSTASGVYRCLPVLGSAPGFKGISNNPLIYDHVVNN